MLPEFFTIGPLSIRAYGLTLALSFLIGLAIIRRQARVIGIDPERIVSLGFVLIVFGVLGGRLGYVIYHLDYFLAHPLETINPFGSSGQFGIAGLNLQGGMILAFLAGTVYVRRHKIPVAKAFDAIAPAMAFGIALTRVGCFMNGCCFGVPTECPLGMHFPGDSAPFQAFGNAAIHPTQLYSSAYGLGLFALLWLVNRRWYRAGLTIGLFFVIEAAFRFGIEPLRYYEDAMVFTMSGWRITFNQVVALGMLALGLGFVIRAYRPGRAAQPEAVSRVKTA